jgi:hypothetical protein
MLVAGLLTRWAAVALAGDRTGVIATAGRDCLCLHATHDAYCTATIYSQRTPDVRPACPPGNPEILGEMSGGVVTNHQVDRNASVVGSKSGGQVEPTRYRIVVDRRSPWHSISSLMRSTCRL